MDNFTKEQINAAMDALPYEVHKVLFSPEIEQKVVKLGFSAGLLVDQLKTANNLVNFAIMNLVSRENFASAAEEDLSLTNEVAKDLANGISREIFASIEAIEAQAKKERALYDETEGEVTGNAEGVAEIVPIAKEAVVEKPKPLAVQMSDVAPDNLPTGEEESFLPNLAPKTKAEGEESTHPFEEKMKKVFTAGQQSMGDLAIEPAPQATIVQAPKAPSVNQADPYREPIE